MTEYYSAFEEALSEGLSTGIYMHTTSAIFSIASYVLTALALYTMAKRRGIHHAWLCWLPVGNVWVLGALSDHYRYITRGENKAKRKVLLTLSIITLVLSFILLIICGMMLVRVAAMLINDARFTDFTELGIHLILLLCLGLPLCIIAVVSAVIQYMALYDIYASADPRNRVLYLLLSIFCSFAQPLVLFFNRSRDDGMPPRIPDPQYQPPYQPESYQPAPETPPQYE